MDKVFVKFDTNTLEVQGFLIEEQLEEGSEYIEIDSKTEERLRTMSNENCGTLFVVDVKNKKFESRVISLENIPLSKSNKRFRGRKSTVEGSVGSNDRRKGFSNFRDTISIS